MPSLQDLCSHQSTSTTHSRDQSGSLPPSTSNNLTEGQTADQSLSTQITSDHPPNTPSKADHRPATGSQSTPMSYRVNSARSVSKHLATDLNGFLTEELTGVIVAVEAERFHQFACLEDLWDSEEWKAVTGKLDEKKEDHEKLKQAWIKAVPENQKYEPFCEWVQTLLTFVESCPQPLRQIHFTPLGNRSIRCTPGYADGKVVGGTSSSFRPDSACVMKEVTKLDGWWQVLVPLEFKGRYRAPPSKGATPSASTSGPQGPGVPHGSSNSRKRSSSTEHSTQEPQSKKTRHEGVTQSSSSRGKAPSSRRSSRGASTSRGKAKAPTSRRKAPTSNQPEGSTSGSDMERVRWVTHRFCHPGPPRPTHIHSTHIHSTSTFL